MNETKGVGQPPAGVRASDAERDATVARLNTATGEGRLTLAEFSQRMAQAAAARTRAELDGLLTDLPAAADTDGSASAGSISARPSWHVTPVGGLSVYGPWRMERHAVLVSIVGATRLDLGHAELAAAEVTITKVSLVGGIRVWVPAGIQVNVSGFRLVGRTRVEPGPSPVAGAPIVHIRAFSLVGKARINRGAAGKPWWAWRANRRSQPRVTRT